MKNYFAKLAERAILADLRPPAGVASGKVYDPFEAAAPPPGPFPATEFPSSDLSRPAPERSAPRGIRSTGNAESHPPHGLTDAGPPPEAPDRLSLRPSSPDTHDQPFLGRLDGVPGAQDTGVTPGEFVTGQEKTASERPGQLPEEVPALPLTPPLSPESRESWEAAAARDEAQLQHPGAEQAGLLRQADDFMHRLTQTWRPLQPVLEPSAAPEANGGPTAMPPQTEPLRLQPPEPGARLPEREAARPSVSIGKLTVEVLPPPPPPSAAPVQKVVVVRGARRGGSNLHFSRRFGLGQF